MEDCFPGVSDVLCSSWPLLIQGGASPVARARHSQEQNKSIERMPGQGQVGMAAGLSGMAISDHSEVGAVARPRL